MLRYRLPVPAYAWVVLQRILSNPQLRLSRESLLSRSRLAHVCSCSASPSSTAPWPVSLTALTQLTPDLKHIISKERLPFSIAYFGSLALTLFFAIGVRSTIGTLVAAIVQVAALLTYLAAYLPGGVVTLRMGSQMLLRGAGNVLPV